MFPLQKSFVISALFFSFVPMYAQTPSDAIITIATYVENSNTVPTLADYANAGIIRVGDHNIDGVNAKIQTLDMEVRDSVAEIQKVVDDYNQMISAYMGIVTEFITEVEVVVDQPTDFSGVSYTVEDGPGGDVIRPTGTVNSDKIMEYIIVNGDRVGGENYFINAKTYTFSGVQVFSGTTANAQVKLKGKPDLENIPEF